MSEIPFVAIGNNELGEDIGEFVDCPHCKKQHLVQYGDRIEEDGTKTPSKLLAYYKCGDKAYLCAVNGKSVMDKFNNGK